MLGVPVEADGRLLPATLNNYLGVKPAYAFARDYREVWQPAMRRLILVRAHALQAMAGRDGLALAPSPSILIADSGGYAADVIVSLFPRARLLCLIRDGRDTVITDEAAARDWACTADAMTHAYQGHAPALRRMVRYEDLIADPASCIASLRAWLGVAAPTRTPAPIPEPTTVTSAAWDEDLSDAERAAAAEIMAPRLTALGYES
jgi:Sulfotransferase family